MSGWIKDNLGTKLELLEVKIEAGIEARQKASEASIWAIFNAKLEEASSQFEKYRTAMDEKHKELEEQVGKMRDELKRSNALRAKAETSVRHLEETFARLTRERADEEAALFRKLTMKLEDERRAIEDERRKMADERKKYKHLLEKHKLELEKSAVSAAVASLPATSTPTPPTRPALVFEPQTASPTVSRPSTSINTPSPYRSTEHWLATLGLEEYAETFASSGYNSLPLAQLLDDGDLDIMRITKPNHRKTLLAASAELAKSKFTTSDQSFGAFSSQDAPPPTSLLSSAIPSASTSQIKSNAPANPNTNRPLPKIAGTSALGLASTDAH